MNIVRLRMTWVTIFTFILVIHGSVVADEFKLGLLIPFKHVSKLGNYFHRGEYYATALTIAVDNINKRHDLLPGRNLSFIWNDTSCEELNTLRALFYQLNNGVGAFIGPGCSCTTAARSAAAFNITMISYMCSNPEVGDNKLYPTFARTFAVDEKLSPTVYSLLKYFKWNRVAIVYENVTKWIEMKNYMVKKLREKGVNVTLELAMKQTAVYRPHKHSERYRRMFKQIKNEARIVIFITEFFLAREGMLVAYDEGMINGDYVFIMFQLDQNQIKMYSKHQFKWFFSSHISTVNRLNEVTKAFEAAFVLAIKVPSSHNFTHFQREIKRRSSLSPFYSGVYEGLLWKDDNKTFFRNRTEPPIFGAYLYDAVYQYAIALNKTIAMKQQVTGTAVVNKLKDIQYNSIMGYQIHFDKSANAELNLTLVDLQPKDNTTFEMLSVGEFRIVRNNETNEGEQVFVPYAHRSIRWPNGRTGPPKDEPECGFYGEKCPPKQEHDVKTKIIAGGSGALAFLSLILLYNIYRQYRLEKELKSLVWKINYNEICFGERRNSATSNTSCGVKENALLEPLLDDYEQDTWRNTFVGVYRGDMVAMKSLDRKSVDLTRAALLELKQMRDMRHDNINPFIGACVEPPHIFIVTQYCSKGSLQDILENKDVKLDNMFICSLVSDIVKGMAYIHASVVKSHGNLKSSNCLVDSRWVLKITDYGLASFRAKQAKSYPSENAYYQELLWVAPEILRLPNRPTRGTQKGDVYSFAIILQEFHTREGPYSANYLDPKEIVRRVEAGELPPFRPTVTNLLSGVEELRELMKQAWAESPESRPEFHEIKKNMNRLMINNGMKTNIFDNVVYMMEKYADNLEVLVNERTGQLIEEKKKTDALLERMLPRTVAEQLKKGKQVEAESFHEVSIYFSDIVGFTELSAESSPIQVVTLLNDLYTLFDDIIREYDVYKSRFQLQQVLDKIDLLLPKKNLRLGLGGPGNSLPSKTPGISLLVETIGDAYMVVSGLPIRNGHRHAGEVARMALHLIDSVKSEFIVHHKPGYKLKLRVGIHSGPVVAGVVGNTMPRYCLFGDTVNTASRMESTGEALKVHISEVTKRILEAIGGFDVEPRGEIYLKGKGNVNTYWLQNCQPADTSQHHHVHHSHWSPNQANGRPLSGSPLLNLPGFSAGSNSSLHRHSPSGLRRSFKTKPSANSPVLKRWQKLEDDSHVTHSNTRV